MSFQNKIDLFYVLDDSRIVTLFSCFCVIFHIHYTESLYITLFLAFASIQNLFCVYNFIDQKRQVHQLLFSLKTNLCKSTAVLVLKALWTNEKTFLIAEKRNSISLNIQKWFRCTIKRRLTMVEWKVKFQLVVWEKTYEKIIWILHGCG